MILPNKDNINPSVGSWAGMTVDSSSYTVGVQFSKLNVPDRKPLK